MPESSRVLCFVLTFLFYFLRGAKFCVLLRLSKHFIIHFFLSRLCFLLRGCKSWTNLLGKQYFLSAFVPFISVCFVLRASIVKNLFCLHITLLNFIALLLSFFLPCLMFCRSFLRSERKIAFESRADDGSEMIRADSRWEKMRHHRQFEGQADQKNQIRGVEWRLKNSLI